MNIEWLLSQVFSYVNHFYQALTSGDSLTATTETSSDKEITEAMIFLVLSSGIAAAGFNFVTQTEMDFPKAILTGGLLDILFMIISTIQILIAWRLAGSKLPFNVFLRGTAYFAGVALVLSMVACFAFLGLVGAFRPERLAEARLAAWTVFVSPREMLFDDFPENWTDKAAGLLFGIVQVSLLLSIWWPLYCRRSKLSWKHAAWAFMTYSVLSGLVANILASFTMRTH